MSELEDLYQELILDHTRNPRNRHLMMNADRTAEGYNPLCGDRVVLYVKLEGYVLKEISFEGSGCAISTASVSLLTESLKGKTLSDVKKLFEKFHSLLTGHNECINDDAELGKLAVFKGVREFPMRVKCATLAWHTLNAALENRKEKVTTEGVED